MSIIIIITLFLSAFLGGVSVLFLKKDYTNLPKLILSFSGAYLFSITVLHLIPEVYEPANKNIGIYILIGFLFQLILEQFSEGVEHGHIHKHIQGTHFPGAVMFSLCLHAFLEGMPLSQGFQMELLFGIAVHHVPAAFALGSLLIQNSVSKKVIIFSLLIFASMSPLGFISSDLINNGTLGQINQYFDKLMAIVIGIFLHISTTILFESSTAEHHHFNKKKWMAILLGMSISFLNFLFH